jgi:DDE superfamily endonuclease
LFQTLTSTESQFTSIYLSEKGWTDAENCVAWVKQVFIPFAVSHRIDQSKPILLTMDGHSTHECHELQRAFYEIPEQDVEFIVLCFPSKTTHKLQPLDVLIFAAVQRAWQRSCDEAIKSGTVINRSSVIPIYISSTHDVITKQLVAKAFKMASLFPVDCMIFKDSDFASSQASSCNVHVPPSFPAKFPSSDAEDTNYMPSDYEDIRSLSESSDDDGAIPECETQTNLEEAQAEDSPGQEMDSGAGATDEEQLEDPVSGCAVALDNLEKEIVYMTQSMSAQFQHLIREPIKVVSQQADCSRSSEELLSKLRSVRHQLWCTQLALRFALSQNSASNAHCTSI